MDEEKRPQVGPSVGPQLASDRSETEKQAALAQGTPAKKVSWKDVPPVDFKQSFPDYFFAGFWIRFFAYLVDLCCIAAITGITLGTVFNLAGLEKGSGLISVYGFLSLLIYLAYFTLLTKLNHGQTIGKMIFGIRVICFSETELSWSTVLVREVACRFILKTPPFFLAYLVTIFTPNKQHLGDYFADTSVVTLNLVKAANQDIV